MNNVCIHGPVSVYIAFRAYSLDLIAYCQEYTLDIAATVMYAYHIISCLQIYKLYATQPSKSHNIIMYLCTQIYTLSP